MLLLMLTYGASSLLHFVHNAVYLHDYPNMPAWLNAAGVGLAWGAITTIGAVGYWVYHRVSRPIGSRIIVAYALLGFGGLDHYVIAPFGAHSITMHATIVAEAAAAVALLLLAGRSIRRES